MKVHIVLGSADCYSDWRQWVAKVFCTEAAARRWAAATQTEVVQLIDELSPNCTALDRDEVMREILKLDPQSSADVWEAGTNRYVVVARELEEVKA